MSNGRDTIKESRITMVCGALLLLSIITYFYFLNAAVMHVVMRKEVSQDINHLHTEIASLEAAYIEAQHTIAARIAILDGYTIESEKVFLTRGDTSLVLRDN